MQKLYIGFQSNGNDSRICLALSIRPFALSQFLSKSCITI